MVFAVSLSRLNEFARTIIVGNEIYAARQALKIAGIFSLQFSPVKFAQHLTCNAVDAYLTCLLICLVLDARGVSLQLDPFVGDCLFVIGLDTVSLNHIDVAFFDEETIGYLLTIVDGCRHIVDLCGA